MNLTEYKDKNKEEYKDEYVECYAGRTNDIRGEIRADNPFMNPPTHTPTPHVTATTVEMSYLEIRTLAEDPEKIQSGIIRYTNPRHPNIHYTRNLPIMQTFNNWRRARNGEPIHKYRFYILPPDMIDRIFDQEGHLNQGVSLTFEYSQPTNQMKCFVTIENPDNNAPIRRYAEALYGELCGVEIEQELEF